MKILALLALAGGLPVFAATAPDAIAGKVYRETGGIPSLRAKWEFSLSFDAGGRYHFLKYASGSTLMLNGSISLLNPPDDGTYTYTRVSDTTATLTLNEPGGTLFSIPILPGSPTPTKSVTFQLNFQSAATGEAAYGFFGLADANANQSAPAINLSLRGTVAPDRPLIAGFVIPGTGFAVKDSRDVVIRLVGPSLGQFGVTGAWAAPDFQIYRGAQLEPIGAFNGNRTQPGFLSPLIGSQALAKIFAAAGAFPIPFGTKDAISVVRLPPGAYTVVCTPAATDAGGEALIEVYFLP